MNIKGYAEQYGVSEEVLVQLIHHGVFEDLSTDLDRDFEKEQIQVRLSSCICLYSMGLDVATITDYITLEEKDENTAQIRIKILSKARKKMLNRMHEVKNALDCIDCIIKEVKHMK